MHFSLYYKTRTSSCSKARFKRKQTRRQQQLYTTATRERECERERHALIQNKTCWSCADVGVAAAVHVKSLFVGRRRCQAPNVNSASSDDDESIQKLLLSGLLSRCLSNRFSSVVWLLFSLLFVYVWHEVDKATTANKRLIGPESFFVRKSL